MIDLSEGLLKLALRAPSPVLDALFGKKDTWPNGYVSTTSPASYPDDYMGPR